MVRVSTPQKLANAINLGFERFLALVLFFHLLKPAIKHLTAHHWLGMRCYMPTDMMKAMEKSSTIQSCHLLDLLGQVLLEEWLCHRLTIFEVILNNF